MRSLPDEPALKFGNAPVVRNCPVHDVAEFYLFICHDFPLMRRKGIETLLLPQSLRRAPKKNLQLTAPSRGLTFSSHTLDSLDGYVFFQTDSHMLRVFFSTTAPHWRAASFASTSPKTRNAPLLVRNTR